MTTNINTSPIRRALLSVSDKTGLVEFARALHEFDVEIISTGGTARLLRDAGISVRDVSEVTGFPEIMDGRVKTLHPRIHGGLLALRANSDHTEASRAHDIEMIDLLVVNLYPFEATIQNPRATLDDAIENIDIGGPAMIRSAAKNFAHVAVVVSPDSYVEVINELQRNDGALSLDTRQRLAQRAFARTAAYDASINNYLSSQLADVALDELFTTSEIDDADDTRPCGMFDTITFPLSKVADLRYGENPHQFAALYESSEGEATGVAGAEVMHGKEMSYNNYVDADAAWSLVSDFDCPTCAIIKHTNPAGCATHEVLEQAYRRALMCDPVSAFGGIVAFNTPVDEQTAHALTEIFTEVVVAPSYTDDALTILKSKKNLRVLQIKQRSDEDALNAKLFPGYQIRTISGGFLIQTPDTHRLTRDRLRVVTKRHPTETEITDLLFAWTICKHTKSNAIVYARDMATVGVGAGQMSRVDSVRLGAERARNNNIEVANSVLASDAFFPFRDGLDEAARHRITACIQPGGSVRDEEVIAAADEHNLAMVFTGIRHFRH